jgi:aminotransferase
VSIENLISPVVRDMKPSGIRKFFDIVTEMEDAISLGVGEPDFSTPWNISESAIYSIEREKTHYTSNSGLIELRKEICNYLNGQYDLKYDYASQVLVTVGASEAVDLVFRAIICPGDEVIIHEPCYVSYRPCIELCGGNVVTIETKAEDEFRVTPEQLLSKITPRTKAIILSFPNNPTGGIMEKEDLRKLVEILKEKDIVVISDEIYSELTYGRHHVSIANFEEMKEKTVVINGFSKAFAMTGWRLGYAAGPEALIHAITKIHQFTIMCAATGAQYAGLEAMKNSREAVNNMVKEYNRRRNFMLSKFKEIGLECFEPRGAFYVFPSIKSTGMKSEEFCEKLLRAKKVAVVPGTAFGDSGEGFVRCSYAYSIENLKIALGRIAEYIEELKSQKL